MPTVIKGPPSLPSFGFVSRGGSGPTANTAITITKSDTKDLERPVRGIYVGSAGDVSVVTTDNRTLIFKSIGIGPLDTGPIKRVNATGTTANDLIGLV